MTTERNELIKEAAEIISNDPWVVHCVSEFNRASHAHGLANNAYIDLRAKGKELSLSNIVLLAVWPRKFYGFE